MSGFKDRVAVIDFETTGVGSDARATEIAVVRLEGGEVVDRFASLMHTGVPVPPFIERLTGISNAMLDDAPGAREVMEQAHALAEGCTLVAHNAGFDRVFWISELRRAGIDATQTPFVCTVKLARRLYPEAPNCKLGTLAQFHGLELQGRAHRAMADAMTTALLWQRMLRDSSSKLCLPVDASLLFEAQNLPMARWPALARRVLNARQKPLCLEEMP